MYSTVTSEIRCIVMKQCHLHVTSSTTTTILLLLLLLLRLHYYDIADIIVAVVQLL